MSKTWNCPLCYKAGVPYGKMGCEDPALCPEEKNINWNFYQARAVESGTSGIGISEIANEAKNTGDADDV